MSAPQLQPVPAHAVLEARFSASYASKPDVLRNVELSLRPGEVHGVIGESGSGKSTVALALMRLLWLKGGSVSGSIRLNGRELNDLPERAMRKLRGKEIGLVLQSPAAALNPALRLETQLWEAWRAHRSDGRSPFREQLAALFKSLRLDTSDDFLRRKPAQISVGQAQRVLIAMAALHDPAVLIADEPTSALDVLTQSEALDIFAQLARERRIAVLFISHDLLAVARICRRISILRTGEIVEQGDAAEVLRNPQHEYSKQLVAAATKSIAPWR